ncbi:acetyl-CoA hydrolase/transferase family protein [Nocardioides pantholopis]|uniref:acetyl-CoA hydrolase/transferase family protein n=1 Tax=Nocardioides pantholopis TaxID=2483798 RepID=UPI000FD737CF|nr:acetyl-CoA hydrolase/transferase C-terminal domain-containing protein [Nocardioides pantholopis]
MTLPDLRPHLRPGDTVTWGQACAEPRTLTRALVTQAADVGELRCFVGIPAESEVRVETVPEQLAVHSYCGSGSNAALYDAGRLEIWPVPYGSLPAALARGALRADVVLVQVSPPDERGRHSLGLGDDYFSAAIDTARVVIAEVNDQVPFTLGARILAADDCALVAPGAVAPGELPTPVFSDAMRGVAEQVARLVPDGATLQFGIGALPEAVLAALGDKRDLGIHSGILNETAMRLVRDGVATGRLKSHDRGVAVTGFLGGTRRLFAWAHRNPAVELRPTAYTHDPQVLATSHRLVAINAAIEVDLTGQVNAETVGSHYVGAVGGAGDFLRGAAASEGGLPVIALPSTARGRSRIVSMLDGPVSTSRSEELVVVTEHGVADLRGTSLGQRAERLIAIAAPEHRAALEAAVTNPVGGTS